MKKERLDKVLVDLGYFETKSKASAAILAGNVMIGTEVITKAGFQIDPLKEYDFKIKMMPYVSRGGFKLKKALDYIHANFRHEQISIPKLAAMCTVSETYFRKQFKSIYAVSPTKYILNLS